MRRRGVVSDVVRRAGRAWWALALIPLLGAAPAPQTDPPADVEITAEAREDGFGFSAAAAGDVNGDGFVDYLVGAHGDNAVAEGSGAAYLFLGPLPPDVSASDADAKVTGEAIVDGLGTTVSAAGDVNDDGFDDILIGARSNDTEGIQSGRAYLFHGPLTGTHGALEADAIISGEDFYEMGWSLAAAGDVNGDGFDDVLVGAWMADLVGKAFLYLGPLSGNLSVADAEASFTGVLFSELLGDAVAAGDLNDDGVPDLVLGAPRPPLNGENTGRAYVFFGPVTGDFSATEADVIVVGERINDEFGTAVATGDVNGDGAADLVAGAHQLFSRGTGRAYVFYGPLGENLAARNADAILVGEDSDPVDLDLFGASVAVVGDTNGDDVDDVLVGAADNYAGGVRAGRGYLFHGPLDGQVQAADADRIFTGTEFDELGTSVAVGGDANRDGLSDVIVGAPQFFGTNDFGYADIFFGEGVRPTGPRVVVRPVDPPVVIPPTGGVVRSGITVVNRSNVPVELDLWTEVTLPGGAVRTGSPRSLTVGAGARVTVPGRLRIPAASPSGGYSFRVLVGEFPTAADSDAFTFSKA